ncbi:MAG: hypothetical protein M3R13_07190 [Armatimonadota bacterium]|nr:hypothetical protein [Armatimonadota bacterium]
MIQRLSAFACLATLAAASQAAVVWYGGDLDGRNGAPNEINGFLSEARTYDDFTVTGPTNVSAVWSNNLLDQFTATTASIEIRTGVGVGNGGTLVFSGTFPATVVGTGRSGFGLQESRVRVSGLSVNLAAGTYHLSVTPIGNGSGRSFASSCAGTNGVGGPLANGNAFVDSDPLAMTFVSANYLGSGNWDFSLGVESGTGPLDFFPTSLIPARGTLFSGNLASLLTSDNNRLVYQPGIVFSAQQAPVSYEIVGTAPQQTATELRFRLESSGSATAISQRVEMFDYVAGSYVTIDTRQMTTTDALIDLALAPNPNRFIQAGTRQVKARLEFRLTQPAFSFPWSSRVDLAMWRLTP